MGDWNQKPIAKVSMLYSLILCFRLANKLLVSKVSVKPRNDDHVFQAY